MLSEFSSDKPGHKDPECRSPSGPIDGEKGPLRNAVYNTTKTVAKYGGTLTIGHARKGREKGCPNDLHSCDISTDPGPTTDMSERMANRLNTVCAYCEACEARYKSLNITAIIYTLYRHL